MRLSDHLSPRTVEGVRRDILTQIEAESERSGVAMNSEWANDKATAGNKAGQGQAITRGEEARVRALLRDALNVYPSGINLYWSHDDKRMTSVSIDADGQRYRDLTRDEVAKAARAGIVPGAEGWCWAPLSDGYPPSPDCACNDDRHDFCAGPVVHVRGQVNCSCSCHAIPVNVRRARVGMAPLSAVAPAPPPPWLTAAVLAALPCDGAPLDLVGVYAHVAEHPDYRMRSFAHVDAQCASVLAALVASGDAEAVEGGQAWRRWGVPEGWGWLLRLGYYALAPLVPGDGPCVAKVADDAPTWSVWRGDVRLTGGREGDAESAKRAALRACWTLRAFAALAPTLTTSTPQGAGMGAQVAIAAAVAGEPTRPAQVRHALLAVLTRGAVVGLSYVLEALSAEGVQPAADGAEARQAAAEIGAVIDGARWALSEGAPPGWGWARTSPGATTWLLRPHATDQSVAIAYENGGWLCMTDNVTHGSGDAVNLLAAQTAALAAARRAGLFARPVAPAPAPEEFIHVRVARVLGVEVERVLVVSDNVSSTIERVEVDGLTVHEETLDKLRAAGFRVRAPDPSASPVNALVALARHLCGVHAYEPGSEGMRVAMASAGELAPVLAAFRADVVAETAQRMADIAKRAAEAVRAERGLLANRQTIDASGTWRVYADDGRTVIGEDVLVPHPTDPASVQAQANAILQRDTIDPAWGALEARAERAERDRDAYLSKALASEAREGEEHNRRCEAERELATLQAGLDGLRTWAHGVKGAGK